MAPTVIRHQAQGQRVFVVITYRDGADYLAACQYYKDGALQESLIFSTEDGAINHFNNMTRA